MRGHPHAAGFGPPQGGQPPQQPPGAPRPSAPPGPPQQRQGTAAELLQGVEQNLATQLNAAMQDFIQRQDARLAAQDARFEARVAAELQQSQLHAAHAAQAAQAVRNNAGAAGQEGAVPRVDKFRWPGATLAYKGGNHENQARLWVQFRKLFDGYMEVMNQGQPEWKLKRALLNCVSGPAQEAVQDMDYMVVDNSVSLQAMLDAYEVRLCPTSSKTIAQAEYRQARQLPNEGAVTFYGRLLGYYTRAFPTPGPQTTTQEMYEAFLMEGLLNGLRRDDMRRNLYSKGCRTLSELVKELEHEESARVSTSVRAGPHRLLPTSREANNRGQAEAMDVSAVNTGGNTGCFNCNAPDHQIRNCPKPRRAAADGTRRPMGTAGKPGAGGRNNTGGFKRKWRFSPKALPRIQKMIGYTAADHEDASALLCSLESVLDAGDIEFYEDEESGEEPATGGPSLAAVIAEGQALAAEGEEEEDFQDGS